MVLDLLRRLTRNGTDVRVNGLIGKAVTPVGEWGVAKFWITNDVAVVYIDEGGMPKLAAGADIVGFSPPHAEGEVQIPHYTVHTVDGEEWQLLPTGNCGCGSSLPGFSPFPPGV